MTIMSPTLTAEAQSNEKTANTGLAPGTIVLTLRGEVPVEQLRAGDRIITRDQGAQTLRDVTRHFAHATVIAKDAFGQNRPERDMRISATQPVMTRGESTSITAARHLVGHLREAKEHTLLYRLCCDAEHIIYADGLELTTARAA